MAPTFAFASSTITVTGTNFLTLDLGGYCLSNTTVGGTAVTSCNLSSTTSPVLFLGAAAAGRKIP
jgi:hypothetical protein